MNDEELKANLGGMKDILIKDFGGGSSQKYCFKPVFLRFEQKTR